MNKAMMRCMMTELANCRPIFHSEADFQFSLAWLIQTKCEQARIRLEYCPNNQNLEHVDIWVKQKRNIFIELKYRTKFLQVINNEEIYGLRSQSAQDAGRYYFLKDVERLERFVGDEKGNKGFAVLLTNDPAFWTAPGQRSRQPNDNSFRVHEGAEITGKLDWQRQLSESMRGEFPVFCLRKTYKAEWKDYSNPSEGSNGKFRYLMFEVS
jgi:hypothetical protein